MRFVNDGRSFFFWLNYHYSDPIVPSAGSYLIDVCVQYPMIVLLHYKGTDVPVSHSQKLFF